MKDNKIAEILIELRKEYKFTQSDLAEKLDVTFQAVSKWERGENLPDAYTLIELAKIYHITVDEILKGELNQKKEKKGMNKTLRSLLITIGIVFLMIAPIPYFTSADGDGNGYLIATLITSVLGIVILLFVVLEATQHREISERSKEDIRIDNIVYSTCAVIFLGTGLIWGLWYVSWIVFILGYVVTLILKKE
jgi:transcriptional regulator with XRE-family HTH domain